MPFGHYPFTSQVTAELQRIDANGDGEISLDEFTSWWESPEMAEARKRHNQKCGIRDWNAAEIEVRMRKRMADLEKSRLLRTFKKIDEDESGFIDPVEWRRLCRNMAPHLSESDIKKTFQDIDADGSGEIDFDEFTEWWDSDAGKRLRGVEAQATEAELRYSAMRKQYAKDQVVALENARAQKEEHDRRAAAFAEREAAATALQAAARGREARAEARRWQVAAGVLQRAARGRKARLHFAGLAAEHKWQQWAGEEMATREWHSELLATYGVDQQTGGNTPRMRMNISNCFEQ